MKEFVIEWCDNNGIKYVHITPYQCRLSLTSAIVCDIFWVNRRYHIIKHPIAELVQNRGQIKGIKNFLESVFQN